MWIEEKPQPYQRHHYYQVKQEHVEDSLIAMEWKTSSNEGTFTKAPIKANNANQQLTESFKTITSDQKQSTNNVLTAFKRSCSHSKIKFIIIATVQCFARNLQFTIILKYKPSTLNAQVLKL